MIDIATRKERLSIISQILTNHPSHLYPLSYFSEMIDDRMEEGMKEEEAVGSMESLDEIVAKFWQMRLSPHLGHIRGRKKKKRKPAHGARCPRGRLS